MDLTKFKESYLEVISESKDDELRTYIRTIVEEVLEEAYDEDPQSPEAKKVISLLKKYGYKSFGKKAGSTLSFSKSWLVDFPYSDDHRVYVTKYDGNWESGYNKSLGIESKTGTDVGELEEILKSVASKITQVEKPDSFPKITK
jgi:hypothetical protein